MKFSAPTWRRSSPAQVISGDQPSVALCLKMRHGADPNLVREIGSIFSALFVRQEHLDILFLNESHELALRSVCAPFYKQGGALSNAMARVPGMNALADLHDTFWNVSQGFMHNDSGYHALMYVGNIPTMPLAGVITYGALLNEVNGNPLEVIDQVRR
ncbi:MAG: hypothetical protein ACYCXT_11435 [Acidiferrobacteraceae bacterium]